mmetsp:Transcript_23180/g.37181  ORF Transcript_23180/g.37181 Transcript_23180/m.37181 type:complete len:81 (-) Transcript_23180:160-402(-)
MLTNLHVVTLASPPLQYPSSAFEMKPLQCFKIEALCARLVCVRVRVCVIARVRVPGWCVSVQVWVCVSSVSVKMRACACV